MTLPRELSTQLHALIGLHGDAQAQSALRRVGHELDPCALEVCLDGPRG